jgi:hypothetical protein
MKNASLNENRPVTGKFEEHSTLKGDLQLVSEECLRL